MLATQAFAPSHDAEIRAVDVRLDASGGHFTAVVAGRSRFKAPCTGRARSGNCSTWWTLPKPPEPSTPTTRKSDTMRPSIGSSRSGDACGSAPTKAAGTQW